ncbi:MAG: response regulator [Alphaproteobacteria bacterium]|nr:MAG: response regulator [Alphaproteobacteria bacterium]
MGLKVLVVEDDAILRFDISEHLSAHGYEVLEAENSEEGFSILESQQSIAFLVTDIDMPGILDGLMLAKFAAERWPHVRIVVISGRRQAEVSDLPDGAVFLSKPCDLAAISGSLLETANP